MMYYQTASLSFKEVWTGLICNGWTALYPLFVFVKKKNVLNIELIQPTDSLQQDKWTPLHFVIFTLLLFLLAFVRANVLLVQ